MNRYDTGMVESARRRTAQVAQDVLAGRVSILEAAPELSGLRLGADVPDEDEDFLAFVLIASETDHLPVAPRVRPLWDPAALAEKDRDIARAEAWARDFGLDACRNLVARFGEHPARITWSDEQVRRGLPGFTETIDPSWVDGAAPRQDEGWSLVCRFDPPPAEQGNPSLAYVRFMVEEAPHHRLQAGTRLHLFERQTLQLADVEILAPDAGTA